MKSESRTQLVDALLKIPALTDRQTRDDIVNALPEEIGPGIKRHAAARADLNSIVSRCADFSGGVDTLLRITREDYEKDSLPMRHAEKVWAAIRAGEAPAEAAGPVPVADAEKSFTAPDGPAQIFISYKGETEPDEPLALELARALQEAGHLVFIDKDIPLGAEWGRKIEEAIARCDFLLALLSESAVQSEMVLGEIEQAHHLGRERSGRPRILPLRLNFRARLRYPLSAYLDRLQWAYWEGPKDTPRIIEEILQAIAGAELPGERPEEAPPPPAGPPPLRAPAYAAQPLEPPEGSMDPESHFYIERPGDRLARETVLRQGVTLTIKAPRQMGKSSLLLRTLAAARKAGKQTVFMDFQLFDRGALENAERFFYQFCAWLTDELGQEDRLDDFWKPALSIPLRCTRYLERHLLPALKQPLLLAMDEVDAIFDRDYRSDFFGMLRSWHNKRIAGSGWKQLDLALVTSTEPYQLIENQSQSPFNVGQVIDLDDFTLEQVADLNRRHGDPFGASRLEDLYELLHGHPYLTRRALYWVAGGQSENGAFFHKALEERGPFGDHLRYHLFRLHRRPELGEALARIIRGEEIIDEELIYRLQAAGLVRRSRGKVLARCRLYAEYFREHLHAG